MTYQIALLEVLVISAPKPEDGGGVFVDQIPEIQSSTASLLLGVAIESTLEEKSLDDNEIITPTEDPVPQEPMDKLVNDDLAEHPQAIAEEPGEAGELVEDTVSSRGETECTEV